MSLRSAQYRGRYCRPDLPARLVARSVLTYLGFRPTIKDRLLPKKYQMILGLVDVALVQVVALWACLQLMPLHRSAYYRDSNEKARRIDEAAVLLKDSIGLLREPPAVA